MRDKNLISIKMTLEAEQRRVNAMLYLIDKVTSKADLDVIERGLELSEEFITEGLRLCKEVAL